MYLCWGVIDCNIPNLLIELQIPMGFEWKHEWTHLELEFTKIVELQEKPPTPTNTKCDYNFTYYVLAIYIYASTYLVATYSRTYMTYCL